jgi:hypothetical protein
MAVINDRVARVQQMLGNRTDVTPRIYQWLIDAYVEIAMSTAFETLEDTFNILTANGSDTYNYLDGWRAVTTVHIQLPAANPTTIRRLRKRNIRNIDSFPTTSKGQPTMYANYGSAFVLRPVPDNSYNMIVRVWLKPVIAAPQQSTPIALPDDWLEVLDWMAVLRGHTELLERDKAQEVRTILYGGMDPRSGKVIPGLIKMKMTQRQAEYGDEEYGIRPRVIQYTRTP